MVQESFVESRSSVVPPRLPLDPSDVGVGLKVCKGFRDESTDRVAIGIVEISIGDEPAATRESHETQRTVSSHRHCARGLGISAKLLVVCGK